MQYGESASAEGPSIIEDAEAAYVAAVLDIKAAFSLGRTPRGTFAAHLVVTTRRIELVECLNSFGSKVLAGR